jgi:hypothetical protein
VTPLGRIKVYKSEHAPTHFDDGRVRLFQIAPDFSSEPTLFVPRTCSIPPKAWCVLVHPSRWDAFWMAINQRDVFAHPEIQELLGMGNSVGNKSEPDPSDVG